MAWDYLALIKCQARISGTDASKHSYEAETIIILILQMRKRRHRKAKWLA